jgi:hypothetical protein
MVGKIADRRCDDRCARGAQLSELGILLAFVCIVKFCGGVERIKGVG